MKPRVHARKLLTVPVRSVLSWAGYEVVKKSEIHNPGGNFPPDFDEVEIEDCVAVAPYTMTSPPSIVSLIRAVRYIVQNRISGDLVECGVWKGGSVMAIAKTLMRCGETHRRLWLYDTFEGMSRPIAADGPRAQAVFDSDYLRVSLEDVRKAVSSVGYEPKNFVFVKGRIEDTVPMSMPTTIALLRLDTDWYESTRHELVHLFPLLVHGGVLIIDDYGTWEGARQATDDYFSTQRVPLLLNRISAGARIGVKL
jgi:hypothetical protein